MQEETLTFHITIPDRNDITKWDEAEAFTREFVYSLGLKFCGFPWSTIDLDSPNIDLFLKRAEELIVDGKAVFYGANVLSQNLIEDNDFQAEWYQLGFGTRFDSEIDKNGCETIKAYTIPPNLNIATGPMTRFYNYVSERFKNVVENNNLTGLDFVWVKDIGRYKAPQWFVPVAWNPIGRGVDHPWFDSSARFGSGRSMISPNPVFRRGMSSVYLPMIKRDFTLLGSVHAKLIDLYSHCDDEYLLSIDSYPRFLRHYLPATDFAYFWGYTDDHKQKNGEIWKERMIYLNRKARDILIQHNVISRKEAIPVLVFDKLPDGYQLLDGTAPLPEPLLSVDQITDKKIQLSSDWANHNAIEKPIRSIQIKEALKYLRKAKKDHPSDYNKGLSKLKKQNLPVNLPSNWVQVLSVSNGCKLNDKCTFLPIEEIQSAYDEYYDKIVLPSFDDYPYDCKHLPIGANIHGDWYSLEDNGSDTVDSRVFQVSHEDLSIVFEWATIPLFVFDMLTGFYD
ncbi:MAG: hypothetical protein GY845_37315 [Planctomycetes bacterium]|nr:hypothetical protein [Planctomycetota bacterium]